eukprot:scaffold84300_cov43-Prasinocladus_malaysianus.AAC.1
MVSKSRVSPESRLGMDIKRDGPRLVRASYELPLGAPRPVVTLSAFSRFCSRIRPATTAGRDRTGGCQSIIYQELFTTISTNPVEFFGFLPSFLKTLHLRACIFAAMPAVIYSSSRSGGGSRPVLRGRGVQVSSARRTFVLMLLCCSLTLGDDQVDQLDMRTFYSCGSFPLGFALDETPPRDITYGAETETLWA